MPNRVEIPIVDEEALLEALDLEGEVITTPFTFASTTHALVRKGLTPVFCDIRPDDFTLDPGGIEALITEKTRAIVPVHVYGMACAVEDIARIAGRHHLNAWFSPETCRRDEAYDIRYRELTGKYGFRLSKAQERAFYASIDREGLRPKERLYVHLSSDAETAVTVGRRHGQPDRRTGISYLLYSKHIYNKDNRRNQS